MRGLLVPALAALLWAGAAAAAPERVVSPGGTEAWLIQETSLPLVSVSFRFASGGALDPAGKEGRTRFMVSLLDEGAGGLDAVAFRQRLEDRAIRLSFSSGRDGVTGTLETLRENLEEAASLLGDALARPRFDAEAVERIRRQLEAGRAQAENRPSAVARNAWYELVFGEGPYGRAVQGTEASLAALAADDLRAAAGLHLVRSRLHVGVAGDVDAAALGRALDLAFGDLPAGSPEEPPAEPGAFAGQSRHLPMDVDQTEIVFGLPGLSRSDPDFFPAFVMNAILGGSAPQNRLETEVRQRRGLTYSIYTYLADADRAPLLIGGTATRGEEADTTVSVVRSEVRRMAEGGAEEGELADAKLYLTGSFGLSLDSMSEIAGMLAAMQANDLGIDYLERRNGLVEAVTRDDVRRAAARLLDPERMAWVAVGRTDPFAAR